MTGATPTNAGLWSKTYFVIRFDVTVAELFAAFGSELEEVTLAVFTTRLFALTLTLTVNVSVALAPLASVPTFQTTVPPAPTAGALEADGDALTNVVPCGTASLTTTPLAVLGPRFFTTMV